MNSAIEPARLYTVLTRTGLQTKDPVLYQLLYNLIGNLVKLRADDTEDAGGGGGTTETTVINNIIQILEGGGVSGEDGSPGPPGATGETGQIGPVGPAGTGSGNTFILGTDVLEAEYYPPIMGNAGASGAAGATGVAGSNGLPGQDGLDGQDGWPPVLQVITPTAPTASARVYRSNAQTFTEDTLAAVSFDTEDFDSDDYWDVGDPTKLTIPDSKAGKYTVVGQISWVIFGGTGDVTLGIYVNGTLESSSVANVTGITPRLQVSAILDLAVGDYVELKATVNEGGTTHNTVGGSAETWLGLVLGAGVVSGSGGGGIPVVAGALSIGSATAITSPVVLSTLGTVDWFAPINNTAAIQLQPLGYPYRKRYGALFYDMWYMWGPSGTSLTTQGAAVTLTMTAADSCAGQALTAFATCVILFSAVGGHVGWGIGIRVRASQTSRTLTVGFHAFSAIITVEARLTDGSASPVSNTFDTGAAANMDREFSITFNSAAYADSYLVVTAIVTTNRGSTPNVGLLYGYIT